MSVNGPASEFYRARASQNRCAFEWTLVLFTVAVFACMGVWVWVSAKYESETYNKLTGAHTTTWDALWVELRVQDSPK